MNFEDKTQRLLSLLEEYITLGIAEQIDYKKFYLYSLITHSTAIEGSTVTEIENQLLFDEGIVAKGRSMQEQLMNLDLKQAYEQSMLLASSHVDFSVGLFKRISAMVMKNTGAVYNTAQGTFDSSKGDFRLVGVTAGVGGSSYMNYRKVPQKMDDLCEEINRRRRLLLNSDNIIEKYLLSFDAHFLLVTIHPWVDGNGRMSRLIMNYLQYEFGLVPSKICKENKAEYIQALIVSREQESLMPFREFMIEEHLRNLSNEIELYKKSQCDDIKMSETVVKNVRERSMNVRETKIVELMMKDGSVTVQKIAEQLGVNEKTIRRNIASLKERNIVKRKGGDFGGRWVVIKE